MTSPAPPNKPFAADSPRRGFFGKLGASCRYRTLGVLCTGGILIWFLMI